MTQAQVPVLSRGAILHRRDFLKLSAGSAALLSAGALTAGLAGCAKREPPASGYLFLRPADLVLFAALAPAVLGSTLPAENRAAHIESVLKGVDATAARVQLPAQTELYKLFDLLNTGLTRRLSTGLAKPWAEATPAELDAFLLRWRESSIGLFNAGYRALTKFITGAWVGTESGLKAAGYPGPYQPMFDAVNAA